MLLFIVSFILLCLTIWITNQFLGKFNFLERILIFFLVSCAYIITVMEIAGFLSWLKKPFLILVIQMVITLLIILPLKMKHLKKFTPLSLKSNFNIRNLAHLIAKNKLISVFSLFVVLVYFFLFYLALRFPQNTTDSLYNHLSRIGYWLQQGSLKPYAGFNNLGTTFPYNNSLLMLWSVIFLHSDRLVGLVQYFSTLILSLSIYLTATQLGFPRKGSLLVSLIFLTFPIILFESITAQNDILVSCFLLIAFFFFLKFIYVKEKIYLLFSILSYTLAVGTKQNAFFALPGYLLLFTYAIVINHKNRRKIHFFSSVCLISFSSLVGSYAYLQNWINFGTPIPQPSTDILKPVDKIDSLGEKIKINSARLFYQFITCEGIPPNSEIECISIKRKIIGPLFLNRFIDIESPVYLLEQSEPFRMDRRYSLNEESSWFGIQGWIILIPGILLGMIHAIKNKKPEVGILIITGLIFFLITASFKKGWDPYQGRYLIFPVALILPFCSQFLARDKSIIKFLNSIILGFCAFTMILSICLDDSRPLVSRKMAYALEIWESKNPSFLPNFGSRLEHLARSDRDVWDASRIEIMTRSDGSLQPVVEMVSQYLPGSSSLAILAKPGLFPDYLFFGDGFFRRVTPLISTEDLQENIYKFGDYLLVSPDYYSLNLPSYPLIAKVNEWRLYNP